MDSTNFYSELSTHLLDSTFKREISLDIGASQATLHDYKVSDTSDFYFYNESDKLNTQTSHRFIHWHSINENLELLETSLDCNLTGNQIKLKFKNAPVLPGVSVTECNDHVFVLIATVASVHRIILPHPSRLASSVLVGSSRTDQNDANQGLICLNSTDILTRLSIFYDVSSETLRESSNYHVLNSAPHLSASSLASDSTFPVTTCSWLGINYEGNFVLADSHGNLTHVKLDRYGKVTTYELKQSTLIERFWNYIPSILPKNSHETDHSASSLVAFRNPHSRDNLVFVLSRDLKLQLWSTMKHECLFIENLTSNGDLTGNLSSSFNSSRNSPKAIAGNSSHLHLVRSIEAPDDDLIDYIVSGSTILALWMNSQSDYEFSQLSFAEGSNLAWAAITLTGTTLSPFNVNSLFVNARELYVEEIFKKGRFSLQTIIKSVSALNRTSENQYIDATMSLLIDEATNVVENRVRNFIIRSQCGSSELSAEVYTEIENKFWSDFYSYCIQFHNVANRPICLLFDQSSHIVGILKSSSISIIRPNSPLDQLLMANPHSVISEPIDHVSLKILLKTLTWIHESLNASESALTDFESELLDGEPVEEVAANIVENYFAASTNVISDTMEPLKLLLQDIFIRAPKLLDVIDFLLRKVCLDPHDYNDELLDSNMMGTARMVESFLSSNPGVCLMSEALKQTARVRYEFCRELIILQTLLLKSIDKETFDADKIERMSTDLIPSNGIYLQAYYLITWACETMMCVDRDSVYTNKNTVSMLSSLEMNEFIEVNKSGGVNSTIVNDFQPKSIAAHLLLHKKNVIARKALVHKIHEEQCGLDWQSLFNVFLDCTVKVLWPKSRSFFVAKFLLGYGQYELFTSYKRLLDNWCILNSHSRSFVSGVVYLFLGEPKKAMTMFHHSLPGVGEDSFLSEIFIGGGSGQGHNNSFNDNPDGPTVSFSSKIVSTFYTKVTKLFKIFAHTDIIIEISMQAIRQLDDTDPLYQQYLASFLSTVFMAQLELRNSKEAYQLMLMNPYIGYRRNLLREFIVHLYEKGSIAEMIQYNYGDLSEDFVNIVEHKARSSDLLSAKRSVDYYEIMYAYFVNCNNFRRGASVIYEYAKRLSQEVSGIDSLQKQSRCLALAINCLMLIDKKYSWIIRPVVKPISKGPLIKFSSPNSSAKRKHDDSGSSGIAAIGSDFDTKHYIEVLDVEDMKKDYLLINARHKLLERNPNLNAIALSPISPEDTLNLLINNLFIDTAFDIAVAFKLHFEPILSCLTSRYIHLIESPLIGRDAGSLIDDINDCFIENEMAALTYIANAEVTVADKMMLLIMAYVERYEKPRQSFLHRCVAEKLLSSGVPLPSRLKLSYQKRNVNQLLYLLMSYNQINESVELIMDLIDGYLGISPDYFNLEITEIGSNQPTNFPHQHFKCLLKILKTENDKTNDYGKHIDSLAKKMHEYQNHLLSMNQMMKVH